MTDVVARGEGLRALDGQALKLRLTWDYIPYVRFCKWRMHLLLHMHLKGATFCANGTDSVLHNAHHAEVEIMRTVFNGMPAAMIHDTDWRKSGFSGAQGNCVELAETRGGAVAMRNSRDPNGPALVFTREELAAFFSGVKHGEFDAAASGHTSAAASVVPTDELLKQPDTSSRYRVLGDELQRITNTLSAGETVIDRDTAERLLRLLGAVSLLHRMHRVDRDGHCAICRMKHNRWHPGSRHDVCSVYAALSLHVGRALAKSGHEDDVPDADERQAG